MRCSRLTSFSLNTSRIALARSSLLARISTPFSPDQAMDAPTLRKSNRVLISLAAWLSALSASWRSIFDTMSKLDSLGMDHRVDGYGADRHLGHAVVAGAFVVAVVANGCRRVRVATARDVRYSSLCCRRSAAVHGRLPEWPKGTVCKTVGSAYVGSNPTPATTCEDGPLAANSRARRAVLRCPGTYAVCRCAPWRCSRRRFWPRCLTCRAWASPPGDRWRLRSLAQPTASPLGETLGPTAGHRHTILSITTLNKLDGQRGHRGQFGSRGAPNSTR